MRRLIERFEAKLDKLRNKFKGGNKNTGQPGQPWRQGQPEQPERPHPEGPEDPERPDHPGFPEDYDYPDYPDYPEYPDYPKGLEPDIPTPDFPTPDSPPPLPPSPEFPPNDELPPLPPSPPGSGPPSPPPEDPPTPPEDNKNEEDNDEKGTEQKEDKGKGREKCVRWQDYEEYMHYFDTPEKAGEYYDAYHEKKKPKTPPPETKQPETGKPWRPWKPWRSRTPPGSPPPKQLECLDDVASVAINKMKGLTPTDNYDEATERFIDGFEGEGESSTAWKKFKKFEDSPEDASIEEHGWRLRDPIQRYVFRKEAQVEMDTINHKLHTGEWVKEQMIKGKPVNAVDAYMRIDELQRDIEAMDKMSQDDKYHSKSRRKVDGMGEVRRSIVWVA
jgi:hypothetical protein